MSKKMSIESVTKDWKETSKLAEHWVRYGKEEKGQVECRLCPRHCRPHSNQMGFCRVRGTVNGELHTFNYGKSVAATEEVIETEAVNHFSPGARILSLGNIGCMMSCDFCQNWETSQVKHLDPSVVKFYTPEQIVETCLQNNIGVISWTYNDPVVWHEFVKDTSRIAQAHGIRTLYKSAFYIEEKPVEELIECIDIFSLSLKSMNPEFYSKIAKAELGPVLERTKQVHRSNRHLEISQLIVTGRNDNDEDLLKTIRWMLDNLGDQVPLHFVAFHPAYKYMDVTRTPVEILLRARELGKREGIKHLYLGNVYDEGMADTHCSDCGNVLVKRFGLASDIVGLTHDGACTICGSTKTIKYPFEGKQRAAINFDSFSAKGMKTYEWGSEVKSVHIDLPSDHGAVDLVVSHLGTPLKRGYRLGGGIGRCIVSRATHEEAGIKVEWNAEVDLKIMPVLDRAHFPVSESLEENLLGVREKKKRSITIATA